MCRRGTANRARNMCCGRHKSSIRNRWYLLKQPRRLVPGQVCRPHGSCCPCKYSTVPPLSTKIQWLHALNSCVQAGKGYTAVTRSCMRADEFIIRESAFHSLMSLQASRGRTSLIKIASFLSATEIAARSGGHVVLVLPDSVPFLPDWLRAADVCCA